MFFSVYTLGCKLNQLETEAITDSFSRKGFVFAHWNCVESAIRVINTCTVTSMAEQKARRIIRKALREYPEACIIVTGCYAQMEKAALSALEEEGSRRLFVIPGEKKDRLLDLPGFLEKAGTFSIGDGIGPALPELIACWLEDVQKDPGDGTFRFKPESFSSHARAFLKIQDGCDNRCSYCRVSPARGRSRSLEAGLALRELKALEQRGFAEVVLTGVNISQYRDSGIELPRLLDFLLKETELIRLRLSSIEPEGLNDEFYRALKNERIRPHLHLSVQSGSPKILAKMGRLYNPEDIEKAAAIFRSIRHDPFLACDIIAGFPGETEADFQKTYELCEKTGFAWIHAFPFSPRPGTPAFTFPEKVSERDATRRVKLLTELAHKGRREYINRQLGKEVEAVIEASNQKSLPKDSVQGLSENYLKLSIKYGDKPTPAPGSLIRCQISQISTGHFDATAELLPNLSPC